MASITIGNLDETLERKLRLRAADRNRSVEDEARDILQTVLAQEQVPTGSLADAIRRRIEPLGGIDLSLPPRGPMRASLSTWHDRPGYECIVGSGLSPHLT